MKRMMLYFGSFNPVHKGHIALAEYVVGEGLCDELVLIISPQSPYKEAGKLAPETDRFEMAEIACAASKYPDKIKPSAVEFLLPKPSYTVETLRFLQAECGSRMQFSLLMGSDQIDALGGWKEYERLFDYPIFVYPRRDITPTRFTDRTTLLAGAPLQDFSSTEVRRALGEGDDAGGMLAPGVVDYIRRKELWTPAKRIAELSERIGADPDNVALLIERGKLHYRLEEWGSVLNDFNRVLLLDDSHAEARQYVEMAQEILAFRYKDIYNP